MKLIFTLLLISHISFGQLLEDELVPYRSGDKWGYANRKKELKIPAIYDIAMPFYKNMAIVILNNESTVITKSGRQLLPLAGHSFYPLKNGFFIKTIKTGTILRSGIIDSNNNIILPIEYDAITPGTDILLLQKNHKYGFCSIDGKFITKPAFDQIRLLESGIVLATKDSMNAIFSLLGKQLTPFSYTKIRDFKFGFSIVEYHNLYGFINTQGRQIVSPKYTEISDFYHNYAVVKEDNKYGLIDTTGHLTIQPIYNYLEEISPKLYTATQNGKCALVNASGKLLTSFEFDSFHSIYDQVIIANKNGYYALINHKGELLTRFEYDQIVFSERSGSDNIKYWEPIFRKNKSYLTVLKNQKWGLVECNGKIILQPEYSFIGSITPNLVFVRKETGYALFHLSDGFKTDFIYEGFQRADSTTIIFQKDGLYGLMDKNGNELISPTYEHINSVGGGYCTVLKEGKVGLIDLKGKEILPVRYDKISASSSFDSTYKKLFINDLCLIRIDGKYAYVGKDGTEYFDR